MYQRCKGSGPGGVGSRRKTGILTGSVSVLCMYGKFHMCEEVLGGVVRMIRTQIDTYCATVAAGSHVYRASVGPLQSKY